MIQKLLHEKLLKSSDKVCQWFEKKTHGLYFPIYSSYDVRDSSYKIANVDANIYPAGFNNICPTDKETSAGLFKKYIGNHYGSQVKKVLIIPEEHTQNPFYWENVGTIESMLQQSGYEVRIGFARNLEQPISVASATGRIISVPSAMPGSSLLKDFQPDLIISNNDFSDPHLEWTEPLVPLNPPRELGWYQRKKGRYFKFYNQLVTELSEIIDLDPFHLRVETEELEHFDLNSEDNRKELASKVDQMLVNLKKQYSKYGVQQTPFVFVKNNSGTYGLAVIKVTSGEEVLSWTYKSRKKMKAAKGGREVEGVIIQEGIPSITKAEGASAEPVIYMIGCELAGGFLRTHSEKDETESLNSPGAVYKKLCVSDLALNPSGCPKENAYGWSAKMGLLAIAYETQEMQVKYRGYK